MVLCPDLYGYHGEVERDALIKYFTEKVGPYTYERTVQVPYRDNNIIQYSMEYDTTSWLPI